jgi:hypothetical protein
MALIFENFLDRWRQGVTQIGLRLRQGVTEIGLRLRLGVTQIRQATATVAMLLCVMVGSIYSLLWSIHFRIPPLLTWPGIACDVAISEESFFRSSPIIATLATAVAAISGIRLIQQSKVMRPLMRVLSSLPPPPAMLRYLAAAAALAPFSASLIQETLLDSYSPLIVTWVQGGGGWGHAVAGGGRVVELVAVSKCGDFGVG